jgi:hypothetical protein
MFQVVPLPIMSSKLYTQHQVFVELFLLLTAIVSELELVFIHYQQHMQTISNSLTIAVRSRKSSTNTRCCVYSFEILMMGRGTT